MVSEIYTTIQGECSFTGWPCVLIRLAGCPLRCRYCDTPHALEGGEAIELPALMETVKRSGIGLVEVTGGEPLAQEGARPLIRALLEEGYQVLVETGGGVSIEGVDPRARIILDVKTPDSGMQDRQDMANLERLGPHDEIKFVLCSRADYEWARSFLRETGLAERRVVHFSPVEPHGGADKEAGIRDVKDTCCATSRATADSGEREATASRQGAPGLSRKKLAEWILEDRLKVRLNLQMHVWIWGSGTRGV
ncbi:MAG: radical SAM protein [Candidatus Eisenbacteria sp.]|nr:radical SAM protein [Candidatus Eisenbacteria bacterium]